ncbi:alpha/beta hydrolase [Kamptonema formosum]|uniref:alpha/beta hydrolase n=1 Tax=Kamptonema formosum TaxID=331992 RepID=UPI00034DE691|nr:alpha/beta hydrolase [Oscillatoria sp. PCC 10802]
MDIERHYDSLPFSWSKNPERCLNDQRWLESIIRNSAPFSDWWVKARIVQLAYPNPPDAAPAADALPTYAGLKSEAEIAKAVRSLCDLNQYPDLAAIVGEEYVIKTLNSWKTKQFSAAISRNFEVYADRLHENVFLVTSTATISLHVDRHLPPMVRYRPLFNVNELAEIMRERSCERLTLRTHGYATPARVFYKLFIAESDQLNRPADSGSKINPSPPNYLGNKHFYIGYHWPSEEPFLSPGLWVDFRYSWGIIVKFLFVLGGFAAVAGTLVYALLKLLVIPLLIGLGMLPSIAQLKDLLDFRRAVEAAAVWYWIVPIVFIFWLLLMQLLRLVAYQRDRYRAIHYGAPDLGEFFWRLDTALRKLDSDQPPLSSEQNTPAPINQEGTKEGLEGQFSTPQSPTPNPQLLTVNLIGHSMGGLLMVNVLRILSDRFGKDDRGAVLPDMMLVQTDAGEQLVPQYLSAATADRIGDYMLLDKLILAAPDIPLEFLREGRNNYVRSAMRRCRQIYLMSSDRDTVLRYMSALGNWFSEPSLEMSGLRLGNVYLKPVPSSGEDTPYRPFIRNMSGSLPAVAPTSAYDLFQKFNYIDCSEMVGLNGVKLPLNIFTGVAIDILNNVLHMLGKVDDHGAYFFTYTPSFAILKLLMTVDSSEPEKIWKEIHRLSAGTPLRFLPSQPFLTGNTTAQYIAARSTPAGDNITSA